MQIKPNKILGVFILAKYRNEGYSIERVSEYACARKRMKRFEIYFSKSKSDVLQK